MDTLTVIILWIGFALLVGVVGKNRKIGFGLAFILAIILSPIIGLVIALLSKTKKDMKEEHKFLEYKELAKKAEFKGQIDQAIDHYMDSLYHLENDYKNLTNKKLEEGRTTPEFIGRIIPHVLTISMAALHFEPKFISALFDPEQKHLLTKEYILTSCAKFMPKDENEEAEVVDEVPSGLEDPCDLEDQE